MPGWFIHLDVARDIATRIGETPDGLPGPTNADLAAIIQKYPNYYALGAIGPDLFFFLPDFKGKLGNFIAKIAEFALDLWHQLDDNVIGPWETLLGPIGEDTNELVSRLTGGLSEEIGHITNLGTGIITQGVLDFASRLGDWFGILGSGVGPQLDDKLFYWSDMFHYRRTNEFACDLFRRAVANGYDDDSGRLDKDPEAAFGYEQGVAYALGWMTHIGTDVTGHPFVNEKAGGPYRLHWQRHHLVENHMDGFNCNARQGDQPFYNMYASSALHFWLQFRKTADHTPQYDFLQGVSTQPFPDPPPAEDAPTGPLPQYPTGVTSREYFQRNAIFDVDSAIPPALASFLLDTMKDTFYDRHDPSNNDLMATHPMILAAITAGADGRPDQELMKANYDLFYSYVKFASTDYWRMPKPQVPDVFPNLSPPIPQDPSNDVAPALDDTPWESFDLLVEIFLWIAYVAEWIGYLLTVLPAIILDLATYPARIVLYLFEEALYEMWKAFHLLLVMEGFVLPQPDEIDLGLVQLGLPSQGPFTGLLGFMDDIFGGLLGDNPNPPMTEPVPDPKYPRDTVIDDPSLLQKFEGAFTTLKNDLAPPACPDLQPDPFQKKPSEYLRPWEYPEFNNDGSPIGSELGLTRASPFVSGQVPTVLLGQMPGTDAARQAYENAATPADTDALNNTSLSPDFNLGDPINYSIYVIDQLTADGVDPALVNSFNLDADRGYGYKCWDWNRRDGYQGIDPPPIDPAATVFATFGGDQSFPYPIPCTPSRQFDKTDLCGNPRAPRDIPLDYDPNVPVQIHYQFLLGAEQGFPKCNPPPSPPPVPVPTAPRKAAAKKK
jgi:hypothetical protein